MHKALRSRNLNEAFLQARDMRKLTRECNPTTYPASRYDTSKAFWVLNNFGVVALATKEVARIIVICTFKNEAKTLGNESDLCGVKVSHCSALREDSCYGSIVGQCPSSTVYEAAGTKHDHLHCDEPEKQKAHVAATEEVPFLLWFQLCQRHRGRPPLVFSFLPFNPRSVESSNLFDSYAGRNITLESRYGIPGKLDQTVRDMLEASIRQALSGNKAPQQSTAAKPQIFSRSF
ncbi:hypothetical protein BU17DRAFT_91532 [Hysterangium stoloniferum]|nr:hypothetical protein BU17DRAFT_91532 [Hysterangium stoloniferum]